MNIDILIELQKKLLQIKSVENASDSLLALSPQISVLTIFVGLAGEMEFRPGICDVDDADSIRVSVLDQSIVQTHRAKKTYAEKGMFTLYNIFPAIWHNLFSRISRAMHALPFDDLPLCINSDIPIVSAIVRERLSEPWLSEEKFSTIEMSEQASIELVRLRIDNMQHEFYVDHLPIAEKPLCNPVFWNPTKGSNAHPRPGHGFFMIKNPISSLTKSAKIKCR
jgi:hypothetical protein